MGKIVHGNKNFGYVPINVSELGVYSFGSPVMLPGMVSSSMSVEQSDNSIYADDETYCVIKGAMVRTCEITLKHIPSAYAEYLGFKINANGVLTDTGIFPNHCIFFESEEEDCNTGEATTTLHYLYNVKGGEPSRDTATDEEEVTSQDITVTYTCMPSQIVQDDDNEYVRYAYLTRTDANAATYDTFKTTVLTPQSVMNSY